MIASSPVQAAPRRVSLNLPAPWQGERRIPADVIQEGIASAPYRPTFWPEQSPPAFRPRNQGPSRSAGTFEQSLDRIGATESGRRLLDSIARFNRQMDEPGRFSAYDMHAPVDRRASTLSVLVVPTSAANQKTMNLPLAVRQEPNTQIRAAHVQTGRRSGAVVGVPIEALSSFTDRGGSVRLESFDVAVVRGLVAAIRTMVGAEFAADQTASVVQTVIHAGGERTTFRENVRVNDLLIHGGADELAVAHRALVDAGAISALQAHRADPGISQALAREALGDGSATEKGGRVEALFSLLRDTPTVTQIAGELGHRVVPIIEKSFRTRKLRTGYTRRTALELGPKLAPIDGRFLDSLSRAELDAPEHATRLTRVLPHPADREMPESFMSPAEAIAAHQRLELARQERQTKIADDVARYRAFIRHGDRSRDGHPLLDPRAWLAIGTIRGEARDVLISHLDWLSPCFTH